MTTPATPVAPVTTLPVAAKPAPTAPAAPTTAPVTVERAYRADDYAKPGVMGTVTTVHGILKNAATPVAKAARAAKGGAQVGMAAGTGGIQGFFAAVKAGIQTNAIVAGALSIVTNGYDALRGNINMKQFLGLTAADTVAYTAIGAVATGVATFAPALCGLLPFALPAFAVAGAGIAMALGVGIAGSWLYGAVGHEPIKRALR